MGQSLSLNTHAKKNNYSDRCDVCGEVSSTIVSSDDIYGCSCPLNTCYRCLAQKVVNNTKYIHCECFKEVLISELFDRVDIGFKIEHFNAFKAHTHMF